MRGECSRCKEPFNSRNASPVVVKSGYGRCRSCENNHTKMRSRTLGGRYNLGRSQARHNKHKWELSFQQYATIVASGECFYCDGPLPDAAAGLDRKENGDYAWDTVLPCCAKQPKAEGPRGCNETKSGDLAPILMFARRWYEKYGRLPTEQDFDNKIREFEAERDRLRDILADLSIDEIKKLKRAKSVREFLSSARGAQT